jgi:hypothetical protein
VADLVILFPVGKILSINSFIRENRRPKNTTAASAVSKNKTMNTVLKNYDERG